MSNFSLNNNGTISVHYDNLNPNQVEELIARLEGNLWAMKRRAEDPVEIMKKSAKLNRGKGTITFRLGWEAEEIVVNLDGGEIPEPNIYLTEPQQTNYFALLQSMLSEI